MLFSFSFWFPLKTIQNWYPHKTHPLHFYLFRRPGQKNSPAPGPFEPSAFWPAAFGWRARRIGPPRVWAMRFSALLCLPLSGLAPEAQRSGSSRELLFMFQRNQGSAKAPASGVQLILGHAPVMFFFLFLDTSTAFVLCFCL